MKTAILDKKRAIREKYWRAIYDATYPRKVNDWTLIFLEDIVCRHFIRGQCFREASTCTRLHWLIGPKALMLEFYQVFQTGNLSASRVLHEVLQMTLGYRCHAWVKSTLVKMVR